MNGNGGGEKKKIRATIRNWIWVPKIRKRKKRIKPWMLEKPGAGAPKTKIVNNTNGICVTSATMGMFNGYVIKLKITMTTKNSRNQRRMARRKMTVMRQIKLIRSRKSRQRSRVMMEALPRQKAVIATWSSTALQSCWWLLGMIWTLGPSSHNLCQK